VRRRIPVVVYAAAFIFAVEVGFFLFVYGPYIWFEIGSFLTSAEDGLP
jgi:hypothetical protein